MSFMTNIDTLQQRDHCQNVRGAFSHTFVLTQKNFFMQQTFSHLGRTIFVLSASDSVLVNLLREKKRRMHELRLEKVAELTQLRQLSSTFVSRDLYTL